ncbi:hypothetical protein CNY89_08680, partial [Amaricoccus sp. HAR-UPW-R2A-40]
MFHRVLPALPVASLAGSRAARKGASRRAQWVSRPSTLTRSGSCFVQIGDENVHRVRALMDEVFGEENFLSLI